MGTTTEPLPETAPREVTGLPALALSSATRASSARYSASTAGSELPGAQRRVPTMRQLAGKRL